MGRWLRLALAAAASTAPSAPGGRSASPADQVAVYLAPCESDNKNQSWVLPKAKGPLELGSGGGCVSNVGCAHLNPNGFLTVERCNSSDVYQQWSVEAHSDGTTIIHATSTKCNGGPVCCANVNGGGPNGQGGSAGALMDIYQCGGGGAATLTTTTTHDGTLIALHGTKLCLTAGTAYIHPSPSPSPSPPPPPPAPPTPTEAELICDMKALAVEYAAGVLWEGADLQVVSDALQMGLCPGGKAGGERSASTPLARHDDSAACVHVSAETGHDGAPGEGSVAQPFQTLPYAVAQCRARRRAASSWEACTCIELHEGVHELRETLVLGAAESNLTIRSHRNGTAVISGGRRLDLTFRRYRREVFVADVPEDVSAPFTTLTFKGARMTKARYPNQNAEVSAATVAPAFQRGRH